jgi:hypothetical protein
MSLVNQISNIIALPVGKLASWIEQTYNIQSTDVIEQWNVISGMDMNEKAKPRARSQRTKKQCEYIFSGERAGEQCDVTPKSGVYCSKHTPKDKTVTKAKSSAKKATTEISKDFGSDDDIASTKPKTVKKPKAKKEESDDEIDVVVTPKPKITIKKPKAKKEESDDDEIDVVVTPKPKITIKKPKAKKEEEAKKNESDIEQHPTTEPNVVTEDEDEEPNIPTKPLLKSRKVLSVDKLDNGINVSSDED